MKTRNLIIVFAATLLTVVTSLSLNRESVSSLITDNVKAYSEGEDYSKQRQTTDYLFSEVSLNYFAHVSKEPTGSMDWSAIMTSITDVKTGLNLSFEPSIAAIISCRSAWFHRNCNPSLIGVWQINSDGTRVQIR